MGRPWVDRFDLNGGCAVANAVGLENAAALRNRVPSVTFGIRGRFLAQSELQWDREVDHQETQSHQVLLQAIRRQNEMVNLSE